MIDYRLIRSNRRTLSISIDGEGALVVHAPMKMSQREIEGFIHQKEGWIRQKQELVRQRLACRNEAQIAQGAWIPFLGEKLRIGFTDGKSVYQEEGNLLLPREGDARRHALRWRMQKAREVLTPRVEMWASRTGLAPAKISFGNAGTRWGSMGSQRHLRLNAALVHLPMRMADYVIVHELSHIAQPNHSPAFHALVRSILPGADEIRREMKAFSYVLMLWKE